MNSRGEEQQKTKSFINALWAQNAHRFEQICFLPFNRELCNGTLATERYRHYIIQDTLYLDAFAGAVSLAASKALDHSTDGDRRCCLLLAHGISIFSIEGDHHDRIMARLELGTRAQVRAAHQPSAACHHYTTFLSSTAAQEPFPVIIASLLPCYWVYREVALWMIEEQKRSGAKSTDNPYQDWIDIYAGKEYSKAVDEMLDLTEELANEADENTRNKMEMAFRRGFQLEWMFWDSAYRMDGWPV